MKTYFIKTLFVPLSGLFSKKRLTSVLTAAALLTVFGLGLSLLSGCGKEYDLYVYNWGEYDFDFRGRNRPKGQLRYF